LSLGSVVVVDRALASQAQLAIGTRRLVGLIGLLSLILALGSAFLADQLNPRLRRAAQIESLYGLPVIATIGKNR
jgi:capsular polysaccharide biosynthesis protein